MSKHLYLFNPMPKLDIKTPAKEQIDKLRLACNYALDKKLIVKTTTKKGGLKPLFKKNQAADNERAFLESVDINTGNKFLEGGSIKDETAQRIMNRLKLICPILFEV